MSAWSARRRSGKLDAAVLDGSQVVAKLLIGAVGLTMAVALRTITLPAGALGTVGVTLAIMLASTVLVVLLASCVDAGASLRTGARVRLRDAWRSATREGGPAGPSSARSLSGPPATGGGVRWPRNHDRCAAGPRSRGAPPRRSDSR